MNVVLSKCFNISHCTHLLYDSCSTTITHTCSSTCTGMETRKPTFLLLLSKQMQTVVPRVQSIQTLRLQPLARRKKTSPRIKQLNRYLPRLFFSFVGRYTNVHMESNMHEYNAKHYFQFTCYTMTLFSVLFFYH